MSTRPGSVSPQEGAHRPQSAPWVPPGVLGPTSPRPFATPLTGTRRNRAVEKAHVFLANPALSPTDPANVAWLYGAFDFKALTPMDQAVATVHRSVDRLVERMRMMNPPPPPKAFEASPQFAQLTSTAKESFAKSSGGQRQAAMLRSLRGGGLHEAQLPSPQALLNPAHNNGAPFVKGNLIFDIIATRKHIGPQPTTGLPYRLGQEIYRYAESQYPQEIITTFVGITDNTARRAGRDMYFSASDALSRSQIDFTFVDNQHMFVVFPETSAMRIHFPESIVAIRQRQQDADEAHRREVERRRLQEEQERERLRPVFKVPSPRE